MTDVTPQPAPTPDEPGLPPPAPVPKVLKFIVWGLGALIVLAFIGMIIGIVLSAGNGESRTAAAPVAALSATGEGSEALPGLSLPKSWQIVHVSLDYPRALIHVRKLNTPGHDEAFLIYHLRKGAILADVPVTRR